MGKSRRNKSKRRITLRITLAGWLFLLLSLLIGLAAARSQMPMMFVLFGVMLGSITVSSILSRGMIRTTNVHRELPERAWQYETLYFGYYLRNPRRRAAALGISLREIDPQGVEDSCGYCVYLPSRSVFRAGSRLSADRRGRISLKGVRLWTQFPFGLVVVHRDIDQPASLVVWPAKGRIKSDLLRHGAMEFSTAAPGRLQGGQDEFFGLRDYRSGDNPRWIHWRRSAGRETPVVREMAHPVPDILFVVLDTKLDEREVLSEWQRERILRFAATVIDLALQRGFLVGLALAQGGQPRLFAPASGVGARCNLLDALADVSDPAGPGIEKVVQAIPAAMLRCAQVLLLSETPETIHPVRIAQLAKAGRSLRVIGPTDLDEIFEDNPLVFSGSAK